MMRLLMVSPRCFPFAGGIETHIHEVSTRLVARGHSVDVLTADPSGRLAAEEDVSGVRVTRIKAWPEKRDYYFAPGLYRRVLAGDWDVIHVQGYHTLVPPMAMLAAIRKGTPFVLTFHSGGHSSSLRNAARGVQWRLLRPLVRRSAQLIGVSDFEADFFSREMNVPRDRFTVVQNGAQLPTPTGALPDPEQPLIVSIGRLERYKGHHRAIIAFAELSKEMPQARLRVLGDGPYEGELRKLVQKLGLGDRVTIGGVPPRERGKVADVLSGATLITLLSDYEAHPVAVMESLSLKRPVLVTDTSGLGELARKGLVRAVPLDATPVEIARAMADEIINPRPAASAELPTWEGCADRLLAIYEAVASPERIQLTSEAKRIVAHFAPGSSTAAPLNLSYRLGKIEKLGLLKGRWLDCGCADGAYTRALTELGAEHAVGIDALGDRIDEARAASRDLPKVEFLRTASEQLPFPDNTFDGVLMNEVLEHVTDEIGTLRQLHRVLRPGGHLIVMSPNRWFPFEGHGGHFGKFELRWPVPLLPWLPSALGQRFMNARNYWPRELRELIRRQGFAIRLDDFVWPVLEVHPWLPRPWISSYQRLIPILERIPIIRRFGVSVFIAAQKV